MLPSSNSFFSTSLTRKVSVFICASWSSVAQPKLRAWYSLTIGSPSASFFRNSSNVGGSSACPSVTPRRRTRLPAAKLRTTHSSGIICMRLTSASVGDSSFSKWVGMPASASLPMMNALNWLLTAPLRSSFSTFLPSKAEVSLRNTSTRRSGSSVAYTDFALPAYSSSRFSMISSCRRAALHQLQPVNTLVLAGYLYSFLSMHDNRLDGGQCMVWRIVLLTQVRQHQVLQAIHVAVPEQRCRLGIVQVSQRSADTSLERWRIRALLQQLQVVVCFQHQRIAFCVVLHHRRGE